MNRFVFSSPSSVRRAAFTLTEILVVLGIVLLLSAILLPIFGRVKETGRRATCASNLRQVGLAVQQYLQDSRGLYPPITKYKFDCVWAHRFLPYTRTTHVFECPSYPEGTLETDCTETPTDPDELKEKLNRPHGGYTWDEIQIPYKRLIPQNVVRYPDRFVLLCDGRTTTEAHTSPSLATLNNDDDLKRVGLIPRHGNGVNALFADGHVKWHSMQDLLDKSLWNYR